jgi:hypothetical protein
VEAVPLLMMQLCIGLCNQLDFDGIDDNVNLKNNTNGTGSFSIETWIKPGASNAWYSNYFSKKF